MYPNFTNFRENASNQTSDDSFEGASSTDRSEAGPSSGSSSSNCSSIAFNPNKGNYNIFSERQFAKYVKDHKNEVEWFTQILDEVFNDDDKKLKNVDGNDTNSIESDEDNTNLKVGKIRKPVKPCENAAKICLHLQLNSKYHSHFIGHNGEKIKLTNMSTNCRIQFPNNKNVTEKSNTVMLMGNLRSIERARSVLRKKSPVIVSFPIDYIPVVYTNKLLASAQYMAIQRCNRVKIGFYCNTLNNISYIRVFGNEETESGIVKTVHVLMEKFKSTKGNVTIQLKIFIQQQQQIDIFESAPNMLQKIQEYTNTRIIRMGKNPFTDLKNKNAIKFEGAVEDVLKAKKLILAMLPIKIKIEIPNHKYDFQKMKLIKDFSCITVKSHYHHLSRTRIIQMRCLEYYIESFYTACSLILGCEYEGPSYSFQCDFIRNFFLLCKKME